MRDISTKNNTSRSAVELMRGIDRKSNTGSCLKDNECGITNIIQN